MRACKQNKSYEVEQHKDEKGEPAATTTTTKTKAATSRMASRSRAILNVNLDTVMANDPLRELFEACKTGEIAKVKKLITPQTVNARDTAGRKSTPLHFAAGKCNTFESQESIHIYGCMCVCIYDEKVEGLACSPFSPPTHTHTHIDTQTL